MRRERDGLGKAQTGGSKVLIIFLFLSLLAGTGMCSQLSTQFILFDRSIVFNTNEFSITNRLLVQQTNKSSTVQCLSSVGWVNVIFPPSGIQNATCKEWPKRNSKEALFQWGAHSSELLLPTYSTLQTTDFV